MNYQSTQQYTQQLGTRIGQSKSNDQLIQRDVDPNSLLAPILAPDQNFESYHSSSKFSDSKQQEQTVCDQDPYNQNAYIPNIHNRAIENTGADNRDQQQNAHYLSKNNSRQYNMSNASQIQYTNTDHANLLNKGEISLSQSFLTNIQQESSFKNQTGIHFGFSNERSNTAKENTPDGCAYTEHITNKLAASQARGAWESPQRRNKGAGFRSSSQGTSGAGSQFDRISGDLFLSKDRSFAKADDLQQETHNRGSHAASALADPRTKSNHTNQNSRSASGELKRAARDQGETASRAASSPFVNYRTSSMKALARCGVMTDSSHLGLLKRNYQHSNKQISNLNSGQGSGVSGNSKQNAQQQQPSRDWPDVDANQLQDQNKNKMIYQNISYFNQGAEGQSLTRQRSSNLLQQESVRPVGFDDPAYSSHQDRTLPERTNSQRKDSSDREWSHFKHPVSPPSPTSSAYIQQSYSKSKKNASSQENKDVNDYVNAVDDALRERQQYLESYQPTQLVLSESTNTVKPSTNQRNQQKNYIKHQFNTVHKLKKLQASMKKDLQNKSNLQRRQSPKDYSRYLGTPATTAARRTNGRSQWQIRTELQTDQKQKDRSALARTFSSNAADKSSLSLSKLKQYNVMESTGTKQYKKQLGKTYGNPSNHHRRCQTAQSQANRNDQQQKSTNLLDQCSENTSHKKIQDGPQFLEVEMDDDLCDLCDDEMDEAADVGSRVRKDANTFNMQQHPRESCHPNGEPTSQSHTDDQSGKKPVHFEGHSSHSFSSAVKYETASKQMRPPINSQSVFYKRRRQMNQSACTGSRPGLDQGFNGHSAQKRHTKERTMTHEQNLQLLDPKISLGSLNYVFNGSDFNVLEYPESVDNANDIDANDIGPSNQNERASKSPNKTSANERLYQLGRRKQQRRLELYQKYQSPTEQSTDQSVVINKVNEFAGPCRKRFYRNKSNECIKPHQSNERLLRDKSGGRLQHSRSGSTIPVGFGSSAKRELYGSKDANTVHNSSYQSVLRQSDGTYTIQIDVNRLSPSQEKATGVSSKKMSLSAANDKYRELMGRQRRAEAKIAQMQAQKLMKEDDELDYHRRYLENKRKADNQRSSYKEILQRFHRYGSEHNQKKELLQKRQEYDAAVQEKDLFRPKVNHNYRADKPYAGYLIYSKPLTQEPIEEQRGEWEESGYANQDLEAVDAHQDDQNHYGQRGQYENNQAEVRETYILEDGTIPEAASQQEHSTQLNRESQGDAQSKQSSYIPSARSPVLHFSDIDHSINDQSGKNYHELFQSHMDAVKSNFEKDAQRAASLVLLQNVRSSQVSSYQSELLSADSEQFEQLQQQMAEQRKQVEGETAPNQCEYLFNQSAPKVKRSPVPSLDLQNLKEHQIRAMHKQMEAEQKKQLELNRASVCADNSLQKYLSPQQQASESNGLEDSKQEDQQMTVQPAAQNGLLTNTQSQSVLEFQTGEQDSAVKKPKRGTWHLLHPAQANQVQVLDQGERGARLYAKVSNQRQAVQLHTVEGGGLNEGQANPAAACQFPAHLSPTSADDCDDDIGPSEFVAVKSYPPNTQKKNQKPTKHQDKKASKNEEYRHMAGTKDQKASRQKYMNNKKASQSAFSRSQTDFKSPHGESNLGNEDETNQNRIQAKKYSNIENDYLPNAIHSDAVAAEKRAVLSGSKQHNQVSSAASTPGKLTNLISEGKKQLQKMKLQMDEEKSKQIRQRLSGSHSSIDQIQIAVGRGSSCKQATDYQPVQGKESPFLVASASGASQSKLDQSAINPNDESANGSFFRKYLNSSFGI